MNDERHAVDLLRHLITGAEWPDVVASIDFSTVCSVASRYALLPWLLARLASPDAPAELQTRAGAARELEFIRGTLLLHDLREVMQWLDEAGIRSLPIKGAALLCMTPDSPGWRHTEDIDLLIEPGKVRAAEALLDARGLPLAHPDGAILVDGTPAELGYVSDMHHAYPRRLPRGTQIELHSRPPESILTWEVLWRHAVDSPFGVRVPSPDHHLDILSRHVFRHHYGHVPMVARHVVDVQTILSTSSHVSAPGPDVRFSIWLCKALRSEPGPERWLAQRLVIPQETGAAVRRRIMFFFEQHERIQRDLRHRPTFLLRKLWPHERFMEQEWGPATTLAQRAARHGRRWKALIFESKSRGPGGDT